MEITPDMLMHFKERMHISHNAEDENLKRHLRNSAAAIKRMVGEVDINSNFEAQNLCLKEHGTPTMIALNISRTTL